ncbi:ABC-type multidrug transport system, ATPase and permease components [Tistrella mobilis KA081020-065]|uniref:ABC-type multidrug transport system, ATPase and permease components n=2 Tax=Tistrella mobilis TaxID=171437 RepID=I3TPI1_TISMK|nr:ABC-type multidrug transport system, ATPase and permease components [Tistrella mobilis KA081020-065]
MRLEARRRLAYNRSHDPRRPDADRIRRPPPLHGIHPRPMSRRKPKSPRPAGAAGTRALITRLAREHLRPYWRRIALAIGAMIVTAAATAANAWLMQPVLDDVFLKRDETMLLLVPAAVLAIAAANGFATYAERVLMERLGTRVVADLQHRMYQRLMAADLAFFHRTGSGRLIARFTYDVQLVRKSAAAAITSLAKESLTVIFLVGLMFWQDWLLAIIAFVVFPVAILPIAKLGRRMRKVSDRAQDQIGRLTGILEETFLGARHVKAYGMEGYETRRMGVTVEEIYRLTGKAERIRAASSPIMEALGGVAVGLVIFYGGSQVVAGETTPGAFFSFVTALLMAYRPAKTLANLNANLQEGLAAAHRVFELVDLPATITDRPDAKPLPQVIGGPVKGEIRFEDARFGYGADGAPALDGLDLVVPAGKRVALVGASGAGKSTVINLIPRFYDLDGGRLTIDGADVRAVTLASLRASIALVSQEVTLFNDSVAANIAYGRPDATREDIEAAARDAAAHDFIMALPKGYDTPVGEHGSSLSGGQRQRISIARAMLKNAPILLLDEATSALDTESERAVQDALTRLMAGRTVVVVAHRLSTVVDADLICVMDRGRVIEQGSHAELIAQGGAYARLHALQFADQSEAPVGHIDVEDAADVAAPAVRKG